jgi:hypothetical protein
LNEWRCYLSGMRRVGTPSVLGEVTVADQIRR